ncbi:hypothetical protein D3C85_1060200 [compost metagenome]
MRLGQRLPTDKDAFRQVELFERHTFATDIGARPPYSVTFPVIRLTNGNRAPDAGREGDAPNIRDIGGLQPDIHIVRRHKAQVPTSRERQLRLAQVAGLVIPHIPDQAMLADGQGHVLEQLGHIRMPFSGQGDGVLDALPVALDMPVEIAIGIGRLEAAIARQQ